MDGISNRTITMKTRAVVAAAVGVLSGAAIIIGPRPCAAQTASAPVVALDTGSVLESDALGGALVQSDSAKRAAFTRLRTVTPVRLQTNRLITGDYREVRGDSVRLTNRDGSYYVALSDIQTISVRRNRVAQGALIGGVTTGVIGALGLVAIGHAICEGGQDCRGDTFALGLYGAGIGAIPGALAGALIGAFVPNWRPIYPPPAARR